MKGAIWAAAVFGVLGVGAHEMLHEIGSPREPVAVKILFADGEALPYGEYEIYAPSDANIPFQKGRTDREGYLSFVPSDVGVWRVRVIEKSGHGLDVKIEVGAVGPVPSGGTHLGTWWYVRPVAGAAVILAIFAGWYALLRRRGGTS